MATYNVPYQNLTYNLPDDNEVFKAKGATGGLLKRVGNQIYSIDQTSLIPESERAKYGNYGGQVGYANTLLQNRYGINYDTLKEYNVGDVASAFSNIYGKPYAEQKLTDFSQFIPGQTTPAQSYTQSISPNNPHGTQITDGSGNIIQQSPSLVSNLVNAGATPEQALALQAYAQANPGQPYPAQLLNGLGVKPPEPKPIVSSTSQNTQTQAQAPIMPTVGQMMTNPAQYGVQTQSLSVPPPPQVFSSDYINSVLGQPKTNNDILSKLYEQYQGFQNDYVKAFQKSEQEKQLQAQLDQYQVQNAQLQANSQASEAAIQGQAIPTTFIGGQLQNLREQTALQAQQIANNVLPKELQLTRLQGERKDMLDAMEARLGFAEKSIQFTMDLAQMDQNQRKDALDAQYKAYQMELDRIGLSQRDRQIALDEYQVKNEPFIDAQKQAQDAILNLAQKYPDAGITMTDTLTSASQKVASSGSFRNEQARVKDLANGSSSSNTTSDRTMQVIDGFTTLSDMTTSEAQKVRDDLYAKGFNSDTPPAWYKDYLESQRQQSISPQILKNEWIKYRDGIMKAGTKKSGSGINFDDL